MCACFECLRRRGVTNNAVPDWRGKFHDNADGRYLQVIKPVRDGDKIIGHQIDRGEKVM